MIPLAQVKASNQRIDAELTDKYVAVFAGGTNGIGEVTLKRLAHYLPQPRFYLIGRSSEAAAVIITECERINPKGHYVFIKGDLSLLKGVDEVCRKIKEAETQINLLFMSQGTISLGDKTAEGMHMYSSLMHYGRVRFMLNLLPLIQAAPSPRRIISAFTGTFEKEIYRDDWPAWKLPIFTARGHLASLTTLSMAKLAATRAPDVGFIHVLPGPIPSGITRGISGWHGIKMRIFFAVLMPIMKIPVDECAERNVFLATSAALPAASSAQASEGDETNISQRPVDGIPVKSGEGGEKTKVKSESLVRGIDGKPGSGVYSIAQNATPASKQVETLLARFRTDGTMDAAWEHTLAQLASVTGTESI